MLYLTSELLLPSASLPLIPASARMLLFATPASLPVPTNSILSVAAYLGELFFCFTLQFPSFQKGPKSLRISLRGPHTSPSQNKTFTHIFVMMAFLCNLFPGKPFPKLQPTACFKPFFSLPGGLCTYMTYWRKEEKMKLFYFIARPLFMHLHTYVGRCNI